MAVQTITYDDKQYLNQNSSIADVNKCNDTDLNEIKSVVNNNADELTSLEGQFNLSNSETITSGTITGGGSLSSVNVTIDSNSDGSLSKIYGQIDVATSGHSGNVTIQTSLSPTTQMIVNGAIYRSISSGGYVRNNAIISFTLNTDGEIIIPYVYTIGSSDTCRLSLISCLTFIKNIGD